MDVHCILCIDEVLLLQCIDEAMVMMSREKGQ